MVTRASGTRTFRSDTMGTELRPLGVACNIGCQYCYQHPQRDVEPPVKRYDMEAMKAAVRQEGGGFTLFGGEPLLVPLDDLEELWAFGLKEYVRNGVQTNGTLITPEHIELFLKYKVGVGLSIDGPEDLNDIRWAGTLGKTRSLTQRTEDAIAMLVQAGIPPSIITTLHRGNATWDKLPRMAAWFRELDAMGIRSARLHLLEVENDAVRVSYHLSQEENVEAMLYFSALEDELATLRFDVFQEIEQLMRATDDKVSCVWNACDPYTTSAVSGVEGNGQRSNCGRTNKEGINFIKARRVNYMRYIALYHTPKSMGGCQGCRFFSMCKGHCPGTSINGDWRNRTEHCAVWMALFERCEQMLQARGELPLSLHPARETFEQALLDHWRKDRHTSLKHTLIRIASQQSKSPDMRSKGGLDCE